MYNYHEPPLVEFQLRLIKRVIMFFLRPKFIYKKILNSNISLIRVNRASQRNIYNHIR